ncbi:MAG: alpha/beta hydrolase [Bacteroidia bacterium]|nr:alpha/beta hydrolase [Bacteroidia bacterium]
MPLTLRTRILLWFDQLSHTQPLHTLDPIAARQAINRQARLADRLIAYPPAPASHYTDTMIPGPDGYEVPLRIYRPLDGEGHPVILYLHGGGFTVGGLETHGRLCWRIAQETGAVVVFVRYRLAPEHPFPAGLEDCQAALVWTRAHIGPYGGAPDKLIVMGDSAGGNLAAALCLACRDRGIPGPLAQVLIYPVTDMRCDAPSHEELGTGYWLTSQTVRWYHRQYIRRQADLDHPYASVLRASDLRDLPPALVITAAYDPLRDEGEAFALRLQEAGVPVTAQRYPGVIHAFFNMQRWLPEARAALAQVSTFIRQVVHT